MTDEPGHEESVSGTLGSSALPASTLQTTEQQKKVQEKLIVCRAIHHKPPGIPSQFSF